jgi:hypothetical protein
LEEIFFETFNNFENNIISVELAEVTRVLLGPLVVELSMGLIPLKPIV